MPKQAVNESPVLLAQETMGSNWTVLMCKAPGDAGFLYIIAHNSKLGEIKVDEVTNELSLPSKYIYQQKAPPKDFFCPKFSIISLFEDK